MSASEGPGGPGTAVAEAAAHLAMPRGRVADPLPGVGGACKRSPEDFEVEELPAYTPSGTGEHLYLWVEKRGVAAEALMMALARAAGVTRGALGCAGLKDTQAVTRQWISLPASATARFDAAWATAPLPGVRILSRGLHGNKLRTGHLRGNRFVAVLRGVVEDAPARAAAIAATLAARGMANFYGAQRFGAAGQTLLSGLRALRGEGAPPRGPGLRLALSAAQAALFNGLLQQRLAQGRLATVEAGEVLQVVASGGPFTCDDPVRDQARYQAREVVPAGPMYGPKMRAASGAAAAREAAHLAACGLTAASFTRFGRLTQGTRRAMVVWPGELAVTPAGPAALRLRFTLPPGSYATVLLAEFIG